MRAAGSATLPACASYSGATSQIRRRGAPVLKGKMSPEGPRKSPAVLHRAPEAAPGSAGPRRAGPVFLGSGTLISAPAGASPGRAGLQPLRERVTDPASGNGSGERVKIAHGSGLSGRCGSWAPPRSPALLPIPSQPGGVPAGFMPGPVCRRRCSTPRTRPVPHGARPRSRRRYLVKTSG